MSDEVKMVAAVCTQCGGELQVDPDKEKAVCPFCGTSFLVEKAVNNYNVQHATIEHADNVNIDMKGTVDSVLGFVGQQMAESREDRRERKKQEAEESRALIKNFFRFGMPLMFAMIVIIMVLQAVLPDKGTDKSPSGEGTAIEGELYSEIENGILYLTIGETGDHAYEFDEADSYRTYLSDHSDAGEDTFSIMAEEDYTGEGYAVLIKSGFAESDPGGYYVIRVDMDNGNIENVLDTDFVKELSDYDF
ncbi:MAG: hypothetical protein K6E33_03545 [Lachnospiraceae bacterium]|nr:hypothetical protein [Lachnospiraceae bacterium]